jgi:tetratricopeptide (TPR) repeat protein
VRIVLALCVILLTSATAWAQSPLVAELRGFATRYHEEPARLDKLRAGLAEAVKSDSHVDNLVALAEVCFIWGDVRARTPEDKLGAYDEGRRAARRAVELAPRSVLAHFWHGTNTGRWGETNGVMRSLFLLPTVKQEIDTVMELDPRFVPGYALAGNVYYEVPALLGGGLDRAEQMFRKGLALDPRFTGMRVGLAKTLIKRGRPDEARKELQAVVDERAPTNPADWTMKDSKRARELLQSLKSKS